MMNASILKSMANQINSITLFRTLILKWYDIEGRDFPWRRDNVSCYESVISEILLKRTRAETVARFYPCFFRLYPSWESIALSTVKELENTLRPIGLWKQRAKPLWSLAQEMISRKGVFPKDQLILESLPAVGQYVANAILLFCHGIPRPLLDASMARILERFFGPRKLSDLRYDPYLQNLSTTVVSQDDPVTINWAILDFAAKVCQKKPACSSCPISEKCRFLRVCNNQ